MATVIKGGCPHDCPDSCAWEVTVEDGRVVKLAGSTANPYTHGGLCAKVNHYLDRVYSPDRVLHPLRRVGPKGEGRFEQVGWDEALAEIAERLQAIVAEHGGEAVLPYDFAGNMGLVQRAGIARRFFARLGASRLLRSICGATANEGVAATIGTSTGILPEDIAHSRFIVLWGTNTVVTNLHLWPLIRRAHDAGAQVVVIDPIRTRTAESADWFVQPLPGTDAALALGMMHVIVAEGLFDADYVERYTVGFDELRERLQEYPPERAAQICGLDPDELVRLARAYATTKPAVIRTMVGPEKHPNGGMNMRTLACLPALVGAWRLRGGGLLHWTRSLFDESFGMRELLKTDLQPKTRVVNMVQIGKALTDRERPLHALFVFDANPATIAPNQNLVLEGLARTDLLTVVHDLYITDTARCADFVLPAPSFVEQLDLLHPWGHTYVILNRPAIEPVGDSVSNNELFRRLSRVMGFDEPYLQDSDEELIATALSSGHPFLAGIGYERLMEDGWARLNLPDPYVPFAEGGFPTPSGKCEFKSELMAARGMDALPSYVASETSSNGHPLVMVSAKFALHFLNSSYANLPRHARAEHAPVLEMDAVDAAARGISEGDRVRVYNHLGEVVVQARLGGRVRPGVVAMPHGWWRSMGASANALTSDGVADLGGGGDFYGTRVEVSRVT